MFRIYISQNGDVDVLERRRYHAKILLFTLWTLFNTTKYKWVPEGIKLVASVVHYSRQITVDLFRAQGISIIPHMIRQAEKVSGVKELSIHNNMRKIMTSSSWHWES
jgi:hypothetical protein